MIRGFFFDLDGTLVDTYKADYLAYKEAIKEVLAIDIDEAEFAKTHGQDMYQKLDLLAPGTSQSDAQKIAASKKAHYKKYADITKPNEALIGVMAHFVEHHAMVLVTTAKQENARIVLKKHNLEKYFSHMVFGDEISKSKPDPEAYLLALKKSNLKPEEVIAFEDSDTGIKSAEAAGIAVVHIRTFAS